MNKNLIIGVVMVCVVVLVGAAFLVSGNNSATTEEVSTSLNSENGSVESNSNDLKRGEVLSDSRYVSYSAEGFEDAKDKKRVYFFHASWCPTCKVANEEFSSNPDEIPEDIVLFKTNYDTENDLKKRYGITYQHTFVQVDENGNEVSKWNGGGISELIANVR